jgi:hypothetical protein
LLGFCRQNDRVIVHGGSINPLMIEAQIWCPIRSLVYVLWIFGLIKEKILTYDKNEKPLSSQTSMFVRRLARQEFDHGNVDET